MRNLVGETLGRYRIIEPVGEGGMAAVYRAFDSRLDRDVAVKVIRTESEHDDTFLKRFEREAKALAQLNHPHIVHVNDYGEQNGIHYLVMDYLPGGTLKEKMGRPLPYREAAALLAPIARALEYAHQQKMIHRDVKPGNILLLRSNYPMLTDFGISKMLEADQKAELTAVGVGIGTPDYMSPEQWLGQADPRSDIYSLGVVFYELLTGRRPYAADTPAAVLLKHMNDPLPRPKDYIDSLPENVENAIFKAMAKKPEDRFADMGLFAAALEAFAAEPNSAPKPQTDPLAQAVDQRTMVTPRTGNQPPPVNPSGETVRISERQSSGVRPSLEVVSPTGSYTPPPTGVPARRRPIPIWVFALIGGGLLFVFAGAVIFGGMFLLGKRTAGQPSATPGALIAAADPTRSPTETAYPTEAVTNTPAETSTEVFTATAAVTPTPENTVTPAETPTMAATETAAPVVTATNYIKQYPVNSKSEWDNAAVPLLKGQFFEVQASGSWTIDPKVYKPFPLTGIDLRDPMALLPSARLGILIGKIDPTGTPFAIGKFYSGAAPADGSLFVSINDIHKQFDDNQGSAVLIIVVYPPKQ